MSLPQCSLCILCAQSNTIASSRFRLNFPSLARRMEVACKFGRSVKEEGKVSAPAQEMERATGLVQEDSSLPSITSGLATESIRANWAPHIAELSGEFHHFDLALFLCKAELPLLSMTESFFRGACAPLLLCDEL